MVVAMGSAGRGFAASGDATLSGTVRDVHGTPQLGALVELLRADTSSVASALSDDHGRYILPTVNPGRYQLRATAAFFVPAFRTNVRLQPGTQAIVNLTLSAMFEADNWLPAQRRRSDEPVDDWKWALRSPASRPLLRLVDPETGVEMSSSAEQARQVASRGRVSVTNGDGGFGNGGMHQALVLDRSLGDSDQALLRADVGDPQSGYAPSPSVEMSAGYERRSRIAGNTRLVTSFQSHPELTTGAGVGYGAGLSVLQMATTHQFSLGDLVQIDAGTLVAAEKLEATRLQMEPYVHVTARPGDDVIVEYRYATGRQLQSAEDLDRLKPSLSVLTDAVGRPLTTRGAHHEVSVSRKIGERVVTFSAFTDRFSHEGIAGSGLLDKAALQQVSALVDPTTGTFQVATAGYAGHGLSASFMQPLTPSLSAWAEYDLGTVQQMALGTVALVNLQQNLSSTLASAASVSVRGKILRSGTSLKAQYRWQPARTLTQVNSYNTGVDEAFLSFYVRQRLWCGRLLPKGMDAVVAATNLLEEGYQPVIAPDGHTLFLAQVQRAIQGGLAFNF